MVRLRVGRRTCRSVWKIDVRTRWRRTSSRGTGGLVHVSTSDQACSEDLSGVKRAAAHTRCEKKKRVLVDQYRSLSLLVRFASGSIKLFRRIKCTAGQWQHCDEHKDQRNRSFEPKPKPELMPSPVSHTSANMRGNVEIEAKLDSGNNDNQGLIDDFERYLRGADLKHVTQSAIVRKIHNGRWVLNICVRDTGGPRQVRLAEESEQGGRYRNSVLNTRIVHTSKDNIQVYVELLQDIAELFTTGYGFVTPDGNKNWLKD
ncbi:unnamed protein product, partial [Iphiclides podalirius]